MKGIAGISMIAFFFIGLILLVVGNIGVYEAAKVFGVVIAFVAWIAIASYLIFSD